MAKRFADTALSREAWYRRLTPAHKSAWRFLCDECDAAGVWSIDEDALAFALGAQVEINAFLAAVNVGKTRVERLGTGKLLLTGFVEFQYGELSPDCKPHVAIIKLLQKHRVSKGYPKGIHTLKDKEKDKDREKEEGGAGGDFDPAKTFDAFWNRYPRKIQKTEARDRYERLIKSPKDAADVLAALAKFRAYHEAKGTEEKFLPYPATFMGVEKKQDWRDWLDPKNGTSDLQAYAFGVTKQERTPPERRADIDWGPMGPPNDDAEAVG